MRRNKTFQLSELVESIFETALEETKNQKQATLVTSMVLGRILGRTSRAKTIKQIVAA